MGDDCLRKIADALAAATRRPGDLVARWGGEEFAVILPETDLEGAKVMALALHKAVDDLALRHPTSPTSETVTVSLGVGASTPMSDDTAQDLLRLVDANLYRAKSLGRNRLVAEPFAERERARA